MLIKFIQYNLLCRNNWCSFLAGLSLVFAYAPFSLWWLPFISIPFWFSVLDTCSTKSAFKQGFIFGFGWFASGISWVHVAIDQFGGLPLIVSVLLMALLCCYLALFPALASFLSAKLSGNNQVNLWLFSVCWLVTELLRGTFLTGFPWLSFGYTQINSPLNSLAPVIGEFGLNSVLLLLCISIFYLFKRKHINLSLSLLIIFIAGAITANNIEWVSPTDKKIKVALVQGNIKQDMKWAPELEIPTMLRYLELSTENDDADIVVWPESAITRLEPLAQEFLLLANTSAYEQNAAIITGVLNYSFDTKQYFNSVITLGKKQETDSQGGYFYNHLNRYSKYHLLPIGEFVPFQELLKPIAPLFNLPNSSFSSGEHVQPNLIANGINILPLICYEIAFSSQLSANFTLLTDVLLTVSNDSWFGDSHGPHQHMDIARMRAIEFGRPLLRSTNNGVTGVVDHNGDFIKKIPQFSEAVLKTDINLMTGLTPFAKWGQFTQWSIGLLTLVLYGSIRFYSKKTMNKNRNF